MKNIKKKRTKILLILDKMTVAKASKLLKVLSKDIKRNAAKNIIIDGFN